MNILKKIYCRIYQNIFKIALPLMPYRKPKILESTEDIINILYENNIDNVCVVTDQGIVKAGLIENQVNVLKDNNFKYVI